MTIRFDFEWLDAPGVTTPEFAATWASFRMECGEGVPTRIADLQSKSVREYLYLPLYPIAEWYATRKWALLNEVYSATRGGNDAYLRRHSWRGCGDGHPLPAVSFQPDGFGRVLVEWRPVNAFACPIGFIGSGSEILSVAEIETAMDRLVESVLSRLSAMGLDATPLQEEWNEQTNLTSEEMDYCRLMGRFGKDPFDPDGSSDDLIELATSNLPAAVKEDFYDAAKLESLADEMNMWHSFEKRLDSYRFTVPGWVSAISFGKGRGEHAPHLKGYELARNLRAELGANGTRFTSNRDLAKVLGIPAEHVGQVTANTILGSCVQGMVKHEAESGWAAIASTSNHEANRRFAFCRGIHALVRADSAVLTGGAAERQKEGRAFAAEFLAPGEQVIQAFEETGRDQQAIDEIAEKFGVSSLLIQNQIMNQRNWAGIGAEWGKVEVRV